MESRTKTWRAANRVSFSEASTHFVVLIFENFLTNAIYHFFDQIDSNRLNFAVILIVILLTCWYPQQYGQLYGMLFGSRGGRSFMRRPAAKDYLSFTGTNIALKKTERSKASQIVLYSAVNYRSALCIL